MLTVILSYTSLDSIGKLRQVFDETADRTAKKVAMAGVLNTAKSDMVRSQRALVLFTYGHQPAEMEKARQEFQPRGGINGSSFSWVLPLEPRAVSFLVEPGCPPFPCAV